MKEVGISETSLFQQCSSSIQLRLGRVHTSDANTGTLPEAGGSSDKLEHVGWVSRYTI